MDFDYGTSQWKRMPQIEVCLKSFDNSKYMKQEFLNEIANQHNHGGKPVIDIYGITKNPNNDNYMVVMEFAKQGSLRKLIDSRYNDLNWDSKVAIL
ncbi:12606_t:CDS:2, partial [Cetraspora pellucida]